jgi:drug/metabolite transporter (DMT)-like permease
VLPFAWPHLVRDWPGIRRHAGLMTLLALTGFSASAFRSAVSSSSSVTVIGVRFNRGDAWFLIALLIYAFYTVVLRKRPPMHPLSFLAVGMGWGALLLVPAVAPGIRQRKDAGSRRRHGGELCLCQRVSVTLGYFFPNRGVELIGANRAAPFIHLVPVFGSVMAVAFLGERFELIHAVGYALVFAGITVATRN